MPRFCWPWTLTRARPSTSRGQASKYTRPPAAVAPAPIAAPAAALATVTVQRPHRHCGKGVWVGGFFASRFVLLGPSIASTWFLEFVDCRVQASHMWRTCLQNKQNQKHSISHLLCSSVRQRFCTWLDEGPPPPSSTHQCNAIIWEQFPGSRALRFSQGQTGVATVWHSRGVWSARRAHGPSRFIWFTANTLSPWQLWSCWRSGPTSVLSFLVRICLLFLKEPVWQFPCFTRGWIATLQCRMELWFAAPAPLHGAFERGHTSELRSHCLFVFLD